MTTEKTVDLTVNVSVLNVILAALDEIPHKTARPIFDNLVGQAQPQLQQADGGATAPADPAQ